jgi:hypothetical protein
VVADIDYRWTPNLTATFSTCFKAVDTSSGIRFGLTQCDFSVDQDNCTQARLPPITFKPVRKELPRILDSMVAVKRYSERRPDFPPPEEPSGGGPPLPEEPCVDEYGSEHQRCT